MPAFLLSFLPCSIFLPPQFPQTPQNPFPLSLSLPVSLTMEGPANDEGSMASSSNTLPPFLKKLYAMVDDPETDSVVSWSNANNSFVVWNAHEFAANLLPKHFKHKNFSSFIRQLNTYVGFSRSLSLFPKSLN